MIILTRLHGQRFALNADLVERVESTPDTIITLVDGAKYVVSESLEEIIGMIRDFRAAVIARAQTPGVLDQRPTLAVVNELAIAGGGASVMERAEEEA